MPTTNGDKPQGPTLEDAAQRMASLLDLPEDTQESQTSTAQEAPAAETEGETEAEAEPQETTSQEDTSEAEATETSEETEQPGDKVQLVTVTIDGKAEQIPLDEALRGYQRHSDYSRKTADLANQRRQLEEQTTAVSNERQTYAQMLEALRGQLQQQMEQEPDWNEVYAQDPVGYARRRDEWRDRQEKVAAANFELQRVSGLQQQEHQAKLQEMVQKGRDDMLKKMPAWKDRTVWESDRTKIVEYAIREGYSREEIANAYDPRAVVAMHKARLWDELQAKKPQPVPVKGPKVASAGAAPQGVNVSRLNAAQQRLAKSGRLDDAAKVFEQLI